MLHHLSEMLKCPENVKKIKHGPDLGSNPGRCGGRPATNRLS
jgi:hypothetical protein